MKFKISVVISNYNGLDLLQKNLPLVVENTFSYAPEAEIIVVDDASTDSSVEYLKENFPRINVIKHLKNRGFPSTVNTGFKAARGDLIVSLNNDVSPDKVYLKNAVKLFNDREVFAVSFHEKGYGWAKGFFKFGFVQHSSGSESTKPHRTFWASGGSAIFRMSMLRSLGYFDEDLYSPYYWEDVDLSYRALKRGWKVLWEPDSKVIHNHESTMKKINNFKRNTVIQRNQLLFIWKNITSKFLLQKHIRGLAGRIIKHPGYLRIFFAALLKFNVCMKKRKNEIKESKVSDETIFAQF